MLRTQNVRRNVRRIGRLAEIRPPRQPKFLLERSGYWTYQRRLPRWLEAEVGHQLFRIGLGRIEPSSAVLAGMHLTAFLDQGFAMMKNMTLGEREERDLAELHTLGFDGKVGTEWRRRLRALREASGEIRDTIRQIERETKLGSVSLDSAWRRKPLEAAKKALQGYDMLPANAPLRAIAEEHVRSIYAAFRTLDAQRQAQLAALVGIDLSRFAVDADYAKATATAAPAVSHGHGDTSKASSPLLSEAVESYIARRNKQAGNPDGKVTTAERDARFIIDLAIDILGDKAIADYGFNDLQTLVDALQYWPPNARKFPIFRDKRPAEILAMNHDRRFGIPARKSVEDKYIANFKMVINDTANLYRLPNPFAGYRIRWPDNLIASQKRVPPSDHETLKIFAAGAASNYLTDAMLPLLAFTTGRRIGLLTHLTGTDFAIDEGTGVAYARCQDYVSTDGRPIKTPFKTADSLGWFALHRLLRDIGFVAWAMERGQQFVFPEAAVMVDFADTAQKRMGRLFERCRDEASRGGTIHGFRSLLLDRMLEFGVSETGRRLQVGHETSDVHAGYYTAALRKPDAKLIANLPFPDGFDSRIFKNLNFDALAGKERRRGRTMGLVTADREATP